MDKPTSRRGRTGSVHQSWSAQWHEQPARADNIDQLDSEISLIVYRIVQESLTNVTKHAKANRVVVTIGEVYSAIIIAEVIR